MVKNPSVRHMYNTHSVGKPLMMQHHGEILYSNGWPKHVSCVMYFYIKQVTLDGNIIYFNKQNILHICNSLG
jgi:hypothetical protein